MLRYDRRGYGRRRRTPARSASASRSPTSSALLDGRPAVVFGHSYGGNVALALADRHPELVQRRRRVRDAAVVARLVAGHDGRRRRARHPRRPGRRRRALHAPADRRRALAPAAAGDPRAPGAPRAWRWSASSPTCGRHAPWDPARDRRAGRGDPRHARRGRTTRMSTRYLARCCADCRVVDDRRRPPLRAEHPSRRGRRRDRRARQSSGDATVTSRPKNVHVVSSTAPAASVPTTCSAHVLNVRPLRPHDDAERGEDGEREQLGDDRLDEPRQRRPRSRRRPRRRRARPSRTVVERQRRAPRDDGTGRGAAPVRVPSLAMTDERPIAMSDGLPSTVLPPPTPTRAGRAGRGAGARRATTAATPSPRSRPATRASSTPGRSSATSAATTSSATPTTASATTAGSTPCGPTAGAARATCAGRSRRTGGSCASLAGLGAMAAAIGEHDEAERIATFLAQLDPRRRRLADAVTARCAVLCGGAQPADGHRQGVRRGRRCGRWPSGSRGARGGRVRARSCFVGGDTALLARFGRPVHADRWPGEGPAGGVLTALRGGRRRRRVAACDLPLLDRAAAVGALIAAGAEPTSTSSSPATDRLAAGARAGGRRRRGRVIERLWADGRRSLHELVAGLRVGRRSPSTPSALRNVNTAADLSEAEALLGTLARGRSEIDVDELAERLPERRPADRRPRARRVHRRARARARSRSRWPRVPDHLDAVRRRRPDVRDLPAPAAAAGGRASSSRPRASTASRRSTSTGGTQGVDRVRARRRSAETGPRDRELPLGRPPRAELDDLIDALVGAAALRPRHRVPPREDVLPAARPGPVRLARRPGARRPAGRRPGAAATGCSPARRSPSPTPPSRTSTCSPTPSARCPTHLFDTQVAAGFVGYGTPSLSSLLQGELGVTPAKGDRLTDWLRRPLTEAQCEYAAADVASLLELHDRLVAELTRLGRLAWAEEACEELRTRPTGADRPGHGVAQAEGRPLAAVEGAGGGPGGGGVARAGGRGDRHAGPPGAPRPGDPRHLPAPADDDR